MASARFFGLVVGLVAAAGAGCAPAVPKVAADGSTTDGGAGDGGTTDGGLTDGGTTDGGVDGGALDGGAVDTGGGDTGSTDGAVEPATNPWAGSHGGGLTVQMEEGGWGGGELCAGEGSWDIDEAGVITAAFGCDAGWGGVWDWSFSGSVTPEGAIIGDGLLTDDRGWVEMPTTLTGEVGATGLALTGTGEMEVGGPGGPIATRFEGFGD